jgi:hypothetical protein
MLYEKHSKTEPTMSESDPTTGKSIFYRVLPGVPEPAELGWWSVAVDDLGGEHWTAIVAWGYRQEGWDITVKGRTVGQEWRTDDAGNVVRVKLGLTKGGNPCPCEEPGSRNPYRKFIGWRHDPEHVEPVREVKYSDYLPGGPLYDPADDE